MEMTRFGLIFQPFIIGSHGTSFILKSKNRFPAEPKKGLYSPDPIVSPRRHEFFLPFSESWKIRAVSAKLRRKELHPAD